MPRLRQPADGGAFYFHVQHQVSHSIKPRDRLVNLRLELEAALDQIRAFEEVQLARHRQAYFSVKHMIHSLPGWICSLKEAEDRENGQAVISFSDVSDGPALFEEGA